MKYTRTVVAMFVLFLGTSVKVWPQDQSADAPPAGQTLTETMRKEYEQSEARAADAANKLRAMHASEDDGNAQQRQSLQQELRKHVAAAYHTRQALQQEEALQLQQRLDRIRQTIAARDQIKAKIIDRRVEELLNPQLRWERPTTTEAGTADADGRAAKATKAPGNVQHLQGTPPQSIYNDELKRFVFQLELADATNAAKALLTNREPKVIGAYADVPNNRVVVIAPASSEQAIRQRLAEHEAIAADTQQEFSLDAERKQLEDRRKELLNSITRLEVAKVDWAGNEAEIRKVDERVAAYRAELSQIEKKLDVIRRRQTQESDKPSSDKRLAPDSGAATSDGPYKQAFEFLASIVSIVETEKDDDAEGMARRLLGPRYWDGTPGSEPSTVALDNARLRRIRACEPEESDGPVFGAMADATTMFAFSSVLVYKDETTTSQRAMVVQLERDHVGEWTVDSIHLASINEADREIVKYHAQHPRATKIVVPRSLRPAHPSAGQPR